MVELSQQQDEREQMSFGARGSRPHIVFLLVDDWGFDLFPHQPGVADATRDDGVARPPMTESRPQRRPARGEASR